MTNRFDSLPADFVIQKVRENFMFLSGQEIPTPKSKTKNTETDPNKLFHEMSFVHLVIFSQAFDAAKRRGLLNKVEVELGDVLIATAKEVTGG